ncbi:unnamed protein product [Boreogadus saida]
MASLSSPLGFPESGQELHLVWAVLPPASYWRAEPEVCLLRDQETQLGHWLVCWSGPVGHWLMCWSGPVGHWLVWELGCSGPG